MSDGCHLDDRPDWFVHITDCEGRPLIFCGEPKTFLRAKCGHLEVAIPPGCYTVFASRTEHVQPPWEPFGNHLTHVQVVRVNCGDHVCVTLFQPSGHYCGTWFASGVRVNFPVLERAKIDMKLAQATVAAVEKFIAKTKPDPYTENVKRFIAAGPARKTPKK
jgi:hypothetical protein